MPDITSTGLGDYFFDPLTESDMAPGVYSPPNRGSNGQAPPEIRNAADTPAPPLPAAPQPAASQPAVPQSTAPTNPPQPADAPPVAAPAQPVAPAAPAPSSFLAQITKGKVKQAYRILQYGPGGIGKSYVASQIPNHVFIDLENGTGHLERAVRLPTPRTLDEVRTQLRELATLEHGFTTLCIDSADRLETLIELEVCRENGKDAVEEIPYGKGPGLVASKWNAVLTWLTRLWEMRSMNIMVIAHNTVAKFEDPMLATYDKHQIRLGKKSGPLIFEWADICLFANYRRYTKQEDTGFGNVKNIVLGTQERLWYTTDHPAAAAKSRIALPAEMPMDWQALAKYL